MADGEWSEVLVASAGEAGGRLDRFLADRLPGISRARLQRLIRAGHVLRNGAAIEDRGHRITEGERYRVYLPPPEPATPEAEAIPLTIVYEDDDLIVVDKPKGIPVHPAPGHHSGTLVNALLAHCGPSLAGIGGVRRPGIVHRLDKDTTGLLVVAKNECAHAGLAQQFAAHGADGRLARRYRALVWGRLPRREGTIDAAIGRSAHNRTKMAAVRASAGRAAVTHYREIATFPPGRAKPVASLLDVELETGRTHQIRVHLAHVGHPLLGDMSYGAGFKASARTLAPKAQAALQALGRQALHAAELSFIHPASGKRLAFSSALPADIALLLDALERE
jgi:23S rRNA pseudouridine1911/1915/1917 synthase